MIYSNDKILITGASGFIGTNLVDLFVEKGLNFINFDKSKPLKNTHTQYWYEGNLLNIESLKQAIETYKPTIIIHLAARTDTLSNNIEDYVDNTKGTENLINCIKGNKVIRHVVITSTQYVYKSLDRPFPQADNDYKPHTVYGESKVITEKLTRNADLDCLWTIVRPSNIWGPWHMRYPNELWKIIDKGYYVHASRKEVIRTYGYVKNVVYQIYMIINSSDDKVNQKTFYLGDLPIDSYIWLNAISLQLNNRNIVKLPSLLFVLPAWCGDVLMKLGIKSPFYTKRYRNMIENYYAPTNISVAEFGLSNPDLQANVRDTILWIKGEAKTFFQYWDKKY